MNHLTRMMTGRMIPTLASTYLNQPGLHPTKTGMLNKEAQLDSSPIWNMPKIESDAYGHMAI